MRRYSTCLSYYGRKKAFYSWKCERQNWRGLGKRLNRCARQGRRETNYSIQYPGTLTAKQLDFLPLDHWREELGNEALVVRLQLFRVNRFVALAVQIVRVECADSF